MGRVRVWDQGASGVGSKVWVLTSRRARSTLFCQVIIKRTIYFVKNTNNPNFVPLNMFSTMAAYNLSMSCFFCEIWPCYLVMRKFPSEQRAGYLSNNSGETEDVVKSSIVSSRDSSAEWYFKFIWCRYSIVGKEAEEKKSFLWLYRCMEWDYLLTKATTVLFSSAKKIDYFPLL